MYILTNLMDDLARCHRQIAELWEESKADKQLIEKLRDQLYEKEAEIKELQKKVSVSERTCPNGTKCDSKLWGDPMCQACETKGL